MYMSLLTFVCHSALPEDCHRMIREYLPRDVLERCHVCGKGLVLLDGHKRLHFETHIVCTESVLVCDDCFECFYE